MAMSWEALLVASTVNLSAPLRVSKKDRPTETMWGDQMVNSNAFSMVIVWEKGTEYPLVCSMEMQLADLKEYLMELRLGYPRVKPRARLKEA